MNIQALSNAICAIGQYQNEERGWFSGFGPDQVSTWNHWDGAKSGLEFKLGRGLTDEEITLLSLSLCYGPTPALSDAERADVLTKLWPEGNPEGRFWNIKVVRFVLEGGATPSASLSARRSGRATSRA